MKALSVRAPWWWFILHCGKDIENRDWPTGLRGRVLIHASKYWHGTEVPEDFITATGIYEEANNCEIQSLYETDAERDTLARIRSLAGHIVGSIEIVNCVTNSESPWFFGRYGFVLKNPVACVNPIPFKGALGFFDVPQSIVDQLELRKVIA